MLLTVPPSFSQRLKGEILFRGERFHRDLAEIVGFPRESDVLLNVRRLQLQLARLDIEALKQRRDGLAKHKGAAEHQQSRRDDKGRRAHPYVRERDDGRDGGKDNQQRERRQLDMNIGVAGADDDPVIVVEQEVAVQGVSPGLDHEKDPEQCGAVRNRGGRNAPGRRIETDIAVREVDQAGHDAGQQKQPQQPVLDRDIDRQREEIEADVLVEQRIIPAVRRLVDEPEDEVPPAGLAQSDQQSEDDRHGQDEQTPRQRRRPKSVRPCPWPPRHLKGREARIECCRNPKPRP